MQQSNALSKLEKILDYALENGQPEKATGKVLLAAMNLDDNKPENLVYFYEILSKSQEEAKTIKNTRIDKHIKKIHNLQSFFLQRNLWLDPWKVYVPHINNSNIVTILNLLADLHFKQNPNVFLEKDFLKRLETELRSLQDEIEQSDLSKEFKEFLIKKLEDILKAIQRYDIDGNDVVEKATKLVIADLSIIDSGLKSETRNNSTYKKVMGFVLGLGIFLTPTNVYDIISVTPVIQDFFGEKK